MLFISKGYCGSTSTGTRKNGTRYYTVDIMQEGSKTETFSCTEDVYSKVEMFKLYEFSLEYLTGSYQGNSFVRYSVIDAVPTS